MTEINKLNQKNQFALNLLVQAEYVERKVTDVEFAQYATEKLGFSIKASNIAAARRVFDILSTARTKTNIEPAEGLANRVMELEKRVHELEGLMLAHSVREHGRIGK